jgi:predicted phosphodiesterase
MAGFDQPDIDFLFIGQTHRPWIRKNLHTTVVNVGSIGLPRDHGSRPSYAVLDTITRQAEIIRLTVNPLPSCRRREDSSGCPGLP